MFESLIYKSKNHNHFKETFDYYFKPLCAFAYKYLNDFETTEDLVQEVFLNLWESDVSFINKYAQKSYLYTSVRNKCLNYLKHQSVIRKNEKELILQLESEDIFTNHLIEEDTFGILINEINKLPESCRNVTMLALNGLKNKEIADELNISINTVKTQKKIAFSKLRLSLDEITLSVLSYFLF